MNLSWNVPSESSSGHSLRREGCDILGDATIHVFGYAIAVLLMGSWLAVDITIYDRGHLLSSSCQAVYGAFTHRQRPHDLILAKPDWSRVCGGTVSTELAQTCSENVAVGTYYFSSHIFVTLRLCFVNTLLKNFDIKSTCVLADNNHFKTRT